jgi:phage terminase large subunit-like protein
VGILGKLAASELERLDQVDKIEIPSLRDFLIGAWSNVLHPSEDLDLDGAWYVDLICEELTLLTIGTLRRLDRVDAINELLRPFGTDNDRLPQELTETKNLLINISPRCTKSTIVNVCWPCWEWLVMGWLPDLCLSYGQGLASEHNANRRTLIESDWYKGFARDIKLSRSLNRITEFENDQRGKMVSRGLNAGVTGGGGIRIIFDDPNDPNTVESDVIRAKTTASFQDYSTTRRNNPELCVVVVVQQRTHDRDVSGVILDDPEGWRVVVIQMECERDTEFVFPLSGRIVEMRPGDLMHPSRFSPEVIKTLKKNPAVWAGRYQQTPNVTGGGMFKFANWRLYAELPKVDRTALSLDATFTGGPDSDYVSIGVISQKLKVRQSIGVDGQLVDEHEYYLRHVRRAQLDITGTEQQLMQVIQEFPSATIRLIENKANGTPIISRLQSVIPGIEPFNPGRASKIERAAAVQPIQYRGDVLIPIAEWAKPALIEMGINSISIEDWWALNPPVSRSTAAHIPVDDSFKCFLDELALFPVAANDDQVDMLSMALIWMESNRPKTAWRGFGSRSI